MIVDKLTEIIRDDEVEVVLKHIPTLLPALYPNQATTVTYRGKVIGRADYDPPDSVRISGDIKMPVRVISFAKIVSWNGKPFKYKSSSKSPSAMEAKTFKVAGSNGNTYQITVSSDGHKRCSCPGFGFRGTCKHIEAFNEK